MPIIDESLYSSSVAAPVADDDIRSTRSEASEDYCTRNDANNLNALADRCAPIEDYGDFFELEPMLLETMIAALKNQNTTLYLNYIENDTVQFALQYHAYTKSSIVTLIREIARHYSDDYDVMHTIRPLLDAAFSPRQYILAEDDEYNYGEEFILIKELHSLPEVVQDVMNSAIESRLMQPGNSDPYRLLIVALRYMGSDYLTATVNDIRDNRVLEMKNDPYFIMFLSELMDNGVARVKVKAMLDVLNDEPNDKNNFFVKLMKDFGAFVTLTTSSKMNKVFFTYLTFNRLLMADDAIIIDYILTAASSKDPEFQTNALSKLKGLPRLGAILLENALLSDLVKTLTTDNLNALLCSIEHTSLVALLHRRTGEQGGLRGFELLFKHQPTLLQSISLRLSVDDKKKLAAELTAVPAAREFLLADLNKPHVFAAQTSPSVISASIAPLVIFRAPAVAHHRVALRPPVASRPSVASPVGWMYAGATSAELSIIESSVENKNKPTPPSPNKSTASRKRHIQETTNFIPSSPMANN